MKKYFFHSQHWRWTYYHCREVHSYHLHVATKTKRYSGNQGYKLRAQSFPVEKIEGTEVFRVSEEKGNLNRKSKKAKLQ